MNTERLEELRKKTNDNLEKGTFTFKEGHIVKYLNPDGVEKTLPLGPDQIINKHIAIIELDEAIRYSKYGGETR